MPSFAGVWIPPYGKARLRVDDFSATPRILKFLLKFFCSSWTRRDNSRSIIHLWLSYSLIDELLN